MRSAPRRLPRLLSIAEIIDDRTGPEGKNAPGDGTWHSYAATGCSNRPNTRTTKIYGTIMRDAAAGCRHRLNTRAISRRHPCRMDTIYRGTRPTPDPANGGGGGAGIIF